MASHTHTHTYAHTHTHTHTHTHRWFEQDPQELIDSVRVCLEEVGRGCGGEGLKRIKGIGITNQRETTVLWDKTTGQCLHNAIGGCGYRSKGIGGCGYRSKGIRLQAGLSAVWCDGRTADIAERLTAKTPSKNKDDLRVRDFRCVFLTSFIVTSFLVCLPPSSLPPSLLPPSLALPPARAQPRCGLPIHTYFSALKVKWLMENSEAVRTAIEEARCLFGTVDSWVIWVSLDSWVMW